MCEYEAEGALQETVNGIAARPLIQNNLSYITFYFQNGVSQPQMAPDIKNRGVLTAIFSMQLYIHRYLHMFEFCNIFKDCLQHQLNDLQVLNSVQNEVLPFIVPLGM